MLALAVLAAAAPYLGGPPQDPEFGGSRFDQALHDWRGVEAGDHVYVASIAPESPATAVRSRMTQGKLELDCLVRLARLSVRDLTSAELAACGRDLVPVELRASYQAALEYARRHQAGGLPRTRVQGALRVLTGPLPQAPWSGAQGAFYKAPLASLQRNPGPGPVESVQSFFDLIDELLGRLRHSGWGGATRAAHGLDPKPFEQPLPRVGVGATLALCLEAVAHLCHEPVAGDQLEGLKGLHEQVPDKGRAWGGHAPVLSAIFGLQPWCAVGVSDLQGRGGASEHSLERALLTRWPTAGRAEALAGELEAAGAKRLANLVLAVAPSPCLPPVSDLVAMEGELRRAGGAADLLPQALEYLHQAHEVPLPSLGGSEGWQPAQVQQAQVLEGLAALTVEPSLQRLGECISLADAQGMALVAAQLRAGRLISTPSMALEGVVSELASWAQRVNARADQGSWLPVIDQIEARHWDLLVQKVEPVEGRSLSPATLRAHVLRALEGPQ